MTSIETEKTAAVELWALYQWVCHDCPVVDGVPTYGDAETLAEAQRAIIRHKVQAHNEWQPAPTDPGDAGRSWLSRVEAETAAEIEREKARADGTCRNPDCSWRRGHNGPCNAFARDTP